MLSPYLFYDGNCEAAFKFYEKVLGAKDRVPDARRRRPADMKPASPARKERSCTRGCRSAARYLMASDAPPDHFHKPQGFSVSLTVH